MTPCGSSRGAERRARVWVLIAGLIAGGPTFAADVTATTTAETAQTDLAQLEVAAIGDALANQSLYLQTFINGIDSGMISPYRLIGGSLYGDPAELRVLGFRIDDALVGRDGLIELTRIPGLLYRLDTLKQIVEITVDANQLEEHRYDATAELLRPRVSPGVVLNYDVFGQQSQTQSAGADDRAQLMSGLLDLRAFAQPGTFTQTGLFRSADPEPADFNGAIRLDTTLFHSDADRLDTWRAGDLISGASLPWATPVRLGGLQWQRNFRLQPNLVTFPVPAISGSAAVPSTVDILVNNVQQYSRAVEPGPFTIDNVPVVTGQGEIRVVVRDALGREQVTTLPFYAAVNLLRPGWVDYSLEAGYLRRNYAIESNDYDRRVAGLASVRAGATDWLTLEGHSEGVHGLGNAGVGAVLRLGLLGLLSTSLTGSSVEGVEGDQWSAAYQWFTGRLGIAASTRRASSTFQNLASFESGTPPAREVTQASVSTVLAGGGLSVAYAEVLGGGTFASSATPTPGTNELSRTRIGTLAYSIGLAAQWSLGASVFREFGREDGSGGTVSLSRYFGNRTSVSAAAQVRQNQDTRFFASAAQTLPAQGTGAGWRVQGAADPDASGGAAVGYRFQSATAEAGASGDANASSEFVGLRGAIVSMDYRRWPMLTNSIRESFALVDTGVPNVMVMHENRPIGRSDEDGLLLIPGLTAQSRNQISIDARDVPLDAEVTAVRDIAVPLDQSGVLVKFPVAVTSAATVILVTEDGAPVPVGAQVVVNGGSESFTVGYDGQAYVRQLTPVSTLDVEWGTHRCRAGLEFKALPGVSQQIGPLVCAGDAS